MKNLKNPKKDCGAQPNFKCVAAMAIASVMLCNSPAVADLLANWRLDETSGPALSDANATFSGTISGAVQNQPGKIGTAYSFSGGSNVNVNPGGASAPSAPAPSPTGTVSAWILPTAGNWTGNIVYLQNPTFIQFRMEAANNLTYRQDGGRDRVVSTGAGAIADGVWTHVAATVSSSSIRLYINGSLITTGSGSNGYVSSNSTFLQIGSGAGHNFEGSIDDVAVWNTALSEGKVGTLANTLAVNGGVLNDYNAFMMDKLFTAYDTGTPQSVDSTIGSLTWTKFTGETGTAGSVTYDAANLTYRAFFDSTSGVLTFGPLIIGNGTTNIGTVGSNVALRVNGSTAVANLTANVSTQSVSLNNGGSITGSFSLNQTGGVTANSGSIASNLTGSGGVTMNGTGNTLTLTGNNTYTGNTTISAGTLKMNGSTSALSRFTVASGATLGGNGTIGGDTTIYGIHSPGNSPGIQTFSGNLTYALSGGNGPTVNWQLSGNTDTDFSAFDQIVVGGNLAFNTPTSLVLDFSGYGDVDWADPFWTTDQSWVIYDVTGTTTGFENVTIATANWTDYTGDSFDNILSESSFSLALQGNDLVLNYMAGTSAVPEPGQVAASLLLLSGIGIYLWRRRHAVQAKRQHS